MDIIPVLDLMGGQVVHARGGQRSRYRPIVTPLAEDSTPEALLRGLLRLHPFRTIYVADLDAIEGRDSHAPLLAALRPRFPDVTFWVDAGVGSLASARDFLQSGAGHLVIGSESQRDEKLLRELARRKDVILSLDFRGDTFLGPEMLRADRSFWPERVIVMTLARVGAEAGPDLARIGEFAGGARIYAAGGVRDPDDLASLAREGAAGALVATALHNGRLDAASLAALGSIVAEKKKAAPPK